MYELFSCDCLQVKCNERNLFVALSHFSGKHGLSDSRMGPRNRALLKWYPGPQQTDPRLDKILESLIGLFAFLHKVELTELLIAPIWCHNVCTGLWDRLIPLFPSWSAALLAIVRSFKMKVTCAALFISSNIDLSIWSAIDQIDKYCLQKSTRKHEYIEQIMSNYHGRDWRNI